ncbi:MAG: HNH endonuclease [Colwellia sp.]|nr:HNH endonuclease [Colwellia sp.]
MIDTKGLYYQSSTGKFYRYLKEIGSIYKNSCGAEYINIYNKGKTHKAHRLAWFMFYGKEPKFDVDHKDGDGTNNRINNLRCVTKSINQRNQKLSSRNKSGVAGVLWRKAISKYEITVTVNKKLINLGYTASLFDAACIRKSFNNNNGFTERHG